VRLGTITRILASLWPDTIVTRTIVVLLAGLVIFHLASIWAYQIGISSEIDVTNEARLAERLFSIKRAIEQRPPAEREELAHSLSGGPLEVHWSAVPLTAEGTRRVTGHSRLRERLLELAPELRGPDIILRAPPAGSGPGTDPHLLLASLKLGDGSWINFSIAKLGHGHASLRGIVLSTSLMAVGVMLVSLLILRNVTRPLRACAEAAENLYRGAEPQMLAITGPREIHHLATAFNEMQKRVKRLVDDRTLTLAAISHDLKSPLARLSLRTERIADPKVRQAMATDISEMLAMIDSTLDFLKGDFSASEVRPLDLGATLDSICDDLVDQGHTVMLQRTGETVLRGRPLALKRAFANLIGNAVKYGGSASVTVQGSANGIKVTITDHGPGIAFDEREAMFVPFFRGEPHRDTMVGGAGLGLTIARTIIRAHGGDLALLDAEGGGLKVDVRLPTRTREL
jgi:two-component system OmpR family sensor kinase